MFRLLCQLERVRREKKLESKLPLNIKLNRLHVALYITKDIIVLEVMLLTNPSTLLVTRPNHRQTREKPGEKPREKPLESAVEKGRLRAAKGTRSYPSGYLGNPVISQWVLREPNRSPAPSLILPPEHSMLVRYYPAGHVELWPS